MSTLDLSFLKDVKQQPIEVKQTTTRVSAPKLPESADLRVFSNGKIFPSKEFANKNFLEYTKKSQLMDGDTPAVINGEPVLEVTGNGLDIFSSLDWGAVKGQMPEEVMFISIVPRTSAKVDVFAATKYDEITGEPKASVFTQGSQTFGKGRLLQLLTDTYGIDWEKNEYVDFKIEYDYLMASPNGIYMIPKVISTGARKGQPTYIKRESISVFPMVVVGEVQKINSDAVVENAPVLEEAVEEPQTDSAEEVSAPEPLDFTDPATPVDGSQYRDKVSDNATCDSDDSADWANGLGAPING